jgi:hypothetical protein
MRADDAVRSEAVRPVTGYHSIGGDYTAFSEEGNAFAIGNVPHVA